MGRRKRLSLALRSGVLKVTMLVYAAHALLVLDGRGPTIVAPQYDGGLAGFGI